ncbi:MAG: hypothetical protein ACRDVN_14010 [Jiangellaceae bacterium]
MSLVQARVRDEALATWVGQRMVPTGLGQNVAARQEFAQLAFGLPTGTLP